MTRCNTIPKDASGAWQGMTWQGMNSHHMGWYDILWSTMRKGMEGCRVEDSIKALLRTLKAIFVLSSSCLDSLMISAGCKVILGGYADLLLILENRTENTGSPNSPLELVEYASDILEANRRSVARHKRDAAETQQTPSRRGRWFAWMCLASGPSTPIALPLPRKHDLGNSSQFPPESSKY